ncbi:hypothetical protein BN59_02701 [Legionella massiliensis]|uniref:Uncharacterized protein n=1 Tax=Legionella massiliensis TaxID=1034943 RepID=A0A078KZQ7_9GAMM|nr:hypothetical protein [Legionella massiliensis]CDZ78391.1 hypothetical protein BN59_02701 [Legionella massiliensis]CEE14129.1 hypothetical protein BN1094_02701 [Legionella massiliensis]
MKNKRSIDSFNPANTFNEIVRLADELCTGLALSCTKNTRAPYPSKFQSLVEDSGKKVTIIVSCEVEIPNNTRAWIQSTAKEFFTKAAKKNMGYKADKKPKIPVITIETDLKKVLNISDKKTSDERIVFQFSSNLMALSDNNSLIEAIQPKPYLNEKIVFLRAYLIDKVLFHDEFKKLFPFIDYSQPMFSILNQLMSFLEAEYCKIKSEDKAGFITLTNRMNQFIIGKYSRKSYLTSDFAKLEIADEINTLRVDVDFYLKLIEEKIKENKLSPIKAWNLYSSCFSLFEDALDSFEE